MEPVLQKVTTEFSPEEDRLRIAGVTEDGQQAVVWLTRRMLGMLLPLLVKQLDEQFLSATPEHRDVLQEFAQQAAQDALDVGVEPVKAQQDAMTLLPLNVDLATMENGLLLTFRTDPGTGFRLPLSGDSLRQWLHILYKAHTAANWQLPQWPAWLTGTPETENVHFGVRH
ncbi:hypothetical protein [Pseudoduganella sp. OTU4001]|uniref:hypothetical protein n=1 Tax=Pseudoduganella sp. OTU4001 TaxID=3043854 RepID=UPI00313B9ACB